MFLIFYIHLTFSKQKETKKKVSTACPIEIERGGGGGGVECQIQYSPIALVSSRFAFKMENLNFARTSDLLQETNRR